ncbi:TetR/AcrR family transcriptional regulator [Pseudonocardia eucalypti]|uniref:TetR/AcrR family transcriptional regulator n=1 Tax=Pseudonocardia eucalypti TaxID=648755 RepID=A0ABP9QNI1_9PSEU|nr:AcrR family transcriptional regulator [Pseudonocardia eucalypti]
MGDARSERPVHRRDAAATREAILRSALVAFTRHGYDGVGVREIARAAGVTAMLVNRYFGTKEGLFAEVVEVAFAERTLIADDVESLTRFAAAGLVAAEPRSVDGFLLMLRSVANPRATEILRAAIEAHFQRPLQALLPGAGARERAALFLSVLSGVRLMQQVLGSPALATADADALERRLRPVFEALVDPG